MKVFSQNSWNIVWARVLNFGHTARGWCVINLMNFSANFVKQWLKYAPLFLTFEPLDLEPDFLVFYQYLTCWPFWSWLRYVVFIFDWVMPRFHFCTKHLREIYNSKPIITGALILHGPSMFAVKAIIYGVLYKQSSSIAFDETSSYW